MIYYLVGSVQALLAQAVFPAEMDGEARCHAQYESLRGAVLHICEREYDHDGPHASYCDNEPVLWD